MTKRMKFNLNLAGFGLCMFVLGVCACILAAPMDRPLLEPVSTPVPTATPHTCPPLPSPVVCPTVEYRGLPDVGRALTMLEMAYLESESTYDMIDKAFSSIPGPYQPELASAANLAEDAKLHVGEALAEVQFWDAIGYFVIEEPCAGLASCSADLNVCSHSLDYWLKQYKWVSRHYACLVDDRCYSCWLGIRDQVADGTMELGFAFDSCIDDVLGPTPEFP